MEFQIESIRHEKEKRYGLILLVVGCIFWIIFGLILINNILMGQFAHIFIFIFYIAIFVFASYVSRCLIKAYMFGHYVLLSPNQFPHLYQMVQEGAKQVGLKEAPQAFIYNSHGVMNAMALRLVGRSRYIWLTSAIIDADNDDQVRFVIGHELGHHIAGHLNWFKPLLQMPAYLIPFLGAAYSRARESTCDRIGAFVSGNIEDSRSALQMLACGSAKLNNQMNTAEFQTQENMVPEISGYILHIFSPYPRLTQRVKNVSAWYAQTHKKPFYLKQS